MTHILTVLLINFCACVLPVSFTLSIFPLSSQSLWDDVLETDYMFYPTQGQVIEIFFFFHQRVRAFFFPKMYNFRMQPDCIISLWWNGSLLNMAFPRDLQFVEDIYVRNIQYKTPTTHPPTPCFYNKLKHKSCPPHFFCMTSRSPLYLIQTATKLELCWHNTSTTRESSLKWIVDRLRQRNESEVFAAFVRCTRLTCSIWSLGF